MERLKEPNKKRSFLFSKSSLWQAKNVSFPDFTLDKSQLKVRVFHSFSETCKGCCWRLWHLIKRSCCLWNLLIKCWWLLSEKKAAFAAVNIAIIYLCFVSQLSRQFVVSCLCYITSLHCGWQKAQCSSFLKQNLFMKT